VLVLVAVLVCTLAGSARASAPSHPIVLVPALLGSQIEQSLSHVAVPHWWCEKNSDWKPAWLVDKDFLPGYEVWGILLIVWHVLNV
jgi:lysophospholipase-3